jgi:flagellar biosynthetic protein FliP
MRHRRHTWRAIVEMSAGMLLPAALTMGPYLLGVMTAGTMMSLSHAAMIPLMAVAMMLRFREYAGHKQGHGLAATTQESGL